MIQTVDVFAQLLGLEIKLLEIVLFVLRLETLFVTEEEYLEFLVPTAYVILLNGADQIVMFVCGLMQIVFMELLTEIVNVFAIHQLDGVVNSVINALGIVTVEETQLLLVILVYVLTQIGLVQSVMFVH
jgi:hypothetical protein